jgi:hypothetical protein
VTCARCPLLSTEEIDVPPILIVPGLCGSEDCHWQTHLERAMPQARRVHQADWDQPDRSSWMARLAAAIEATPGAVLVAHSLGCALVAHVALSRPDLHVGGALLVAPADVDERRRSQRLATFAPMPRYPLSFPSIIVASRNDPYITFGRARELARVWQAGFRDAGASGHINVASGFGRWPAAEVLVEELCQRATAPSHDDTSADHRLLKYGT